MLPFAGFFVPLNGKKLGLLIRSMGALVLLWVSVSACGRGEVVGKSYCYFFSMDRPCAAQLEKSAKQTTDVDFSAISSDRDWR